MINFKIKKIKFISILFIIFLTSLYLTNCNKDDGEKKEKFIEKGITETKTSGQKNLTIVSTIPEVRDDEIDPTRLPKRVEKTPEFVYALHVLVSYKGAFLASQNIERSKKEAKNRADKLVRLARKKGENFLEISNNYSDWNFTSPKALVNPMNGILRKGEVLVIFNSILQKAKVPQENFFTNEVVREFENTIFSLGESQVSDVIETPFGYHIIYIGKMDEQTKGTIEQQIKTMENEISIYQLIVYFDTPESPRPNKPKRTKEEAQKIIDKVISEVNSGKRFEDLLEAYSDEKNAVFGNIKFGDPNLPEDLKNFLFSLNEGDVSKQFSSQQLPGAYMLFKRIKSEKSEFYCIVLFFNDSSKVDQKKKAEDILKKAKSGKDFSQLARKFSEDTKSAQFGGFIEAGIGTFYQYPEVQKAIFKLKPEEISDLIESKNNFFIFKRLE